ncbi:HNH endonuclease [Streptomyces sp. NPDC051243]|uniref:HNH endonuclease n=1 Tax=Streptomyces sp. NPDC051243 TaxID=3365646 RepID=UPI0037ADAD9A
MEQRLRLLRRHRRPLNIEHLRPRSRGGSNRLANLVLACVPCNEAKGSKSVEVFLAHRPDRLAPSSSRPRHHSTMPPP